MKMPLTYFSHPPLNFTGDEKAKIRPQLSVTFVSQLFRNEAIYEEYKTSDVPSLNSENVWQQWRPLDNAQSQIEKILKLHH